MDFLLKISNIINSNGIKEKNSNILKKEDKLISKSKEKENSFKNRNKQFNRKDN